MQWPAASIFNTHCSVGKVLHPAFPLGALLGIINCLPSNLGYHKEHTVCTTEIVWRPKSSSTKAKFKQVHEVIIILNSGDKLVINTLQGKHHKGRVYNPSNGTRLLLLCSDNTNKPLMASYINYYLYPYFTSSKLIWCWRCPGFKIYWH